MTGRATHGHTRGRSTTPEFRTWCAMRQRCNDPNSTKYPQYGARGITVCERWASFENFLADMGSRPEGTTLDRIDNDKGYVPDNCRWATPVEQSRNRRLKPFDPSTRPNCPAEHPYAGSNVRICRDGSRKCRECERVQAREARRKKKLERTA